jgi:multidrug efflux pump subunit AcrA (membrane-fusion protein)
MINRTPQASADEGLALLGFNEEDDELFDTKQTVRKRPRKRTLVIISIVLVVVILGGLLLVIRAHQAPGFSYTTQQVQQGTLSLTVNATGPVQGNVYNVDFSNSGTLTALDVSVGQRVDEGQTLAQLSVTSLQNNTSQTITLTAPHAGIVASINGSIGGVPGVSTTIGIPVTGAGNTFIQIADLSSLQVYADVNESDIAGVQVGQRANFTVNAYSSDQFAGTVKAISPLGQVVSSVVTYAVIIQVDMNSLHGVQLLPGMTANTTIATVTHSNTLLVPVSAINFAQSATGSGATNVPGNAITQSEVQSVQAQAQQMLQQLESSKSSIIQDDPTTSYVLTSVNQRLVLKPVVLGLTDGTSYEVLAGLPSGDSVVTASQQVRRGLLGGKGGGRLSKIGL